MRDSEGVEAKGQVGEERVLDEVLREGAQQMLLKAIEAEVAAYIDENESEVDERSRR